MQNNIPFLSQSGSAEKLNELMQRVDVLQTVFLFGWLVLARFLYGHAQTKHR